MDYIAGICSRVYCRGFGALGLLTQPDIKLIDAYFSLHSQFILEKDLVSEKKLSINRCVAVHISRCAGPTCQVLVHKAGKE